MCGILSHKKVQFLRLAVAVPLGKIKLVQSNRVQQILLLYPLSKLF